MLFLVISIMAKSSAYIFPRFISRADKLYEPNERIIKQEKKAKAAYKAFDWCKEVQDQSQHNETSLTAGRLGIYHVIYWNIILANP